MRARSGTRIEETARLVDEIERVIRAEIPPGELGGMLDNIGIQYRAELGNGGSITPRFDMSYTDKSSVGRLSGGGPIEYAPSVSLANARVTWRNAKDDLSRLKLRHEQHHRERGQPPML